jgi:hypothetical protein
MRIHAFLECSLVNGPGPASRALDSGLSSRLPELLESQKSLDGRRLSRVHARSRPAYSSRVRGRANRGPDSFRRRTAPPDHGSTTALAQFETGSRGVEYRSVFRYTEQELQHGRFQTYFPSSIWLRQAQWRELESLLDFAVLGRYNQQQPSAHPLITSRNQQLRLYSSRYGPADFQEQTVEVSIESDGLTHVTGFPILGSIL